MSSLEYHRKQANNAGMCGDRIESALRDLIQARSHYDDPFDLDLDNAIEYTGRAMSNALRVVRDHKDQAADAQRAANTPEVA